MDLVNDSKFETGWLVSKIEPPAFSLTVVVKGTFKLVNDGTVVVEEEQSAPTGDEFEEDDRAKPLRYPMDLAPLKLRADLLLWGQCHAPGGKPVGELGVAFKVGNFRKSLSVTGDRFWQAHSRTTEPLSFVSMPLAWDRAFGGLRFEQNPLGKGLDEVTREDGSKVQPLPNIESPDNLLRTRGQRVEAAGFGPIPDSWPQRRNKFGKINRRYLKERWPWYPENMDWGYFNAAPEDQQLQGFLRGDEELVFENLHPAVDRFRSRLPGIRVRCFLNELVRAHEELREVTMRLDTLWVQPDAERLVLVWRGYLNVRTEKLLEVLHLFVTTEPLTAGAATNSHFAGALQAALARRDAEDEELEPESEADEDEETEDTEDTIEEAESPEAGAEEQESAEEADTGFPAGVLPSLATEGEPEEEADEDLESPEEQEPADLDEPLTLDQVEQKLAAKESFAGCDLSGLVLTGFNFSGCDLREAVLEGAVLVGANLAGADLSGAVLAGANLREANCAGAIFSGADLTEAWLSHGNFTGADFRGADLTKARARATVFKGVRAGESVWEEADLSEADLSEADFTAADLCKARLHRTNLMRSNFTDAAIEEAWGRQVKARGAIMHKLRGASALLCEGDFQEIQGADSVWQSAQLYAADFTRARLDAAEFSTAYLGEAVFDAAEMKSACLDEANLRRARLRRTNLLGASLGKADLSEADFTESNLYGADLMDTTLYQTRLHGANLRRVKAKEEIV